MKREVWMGEVVGRLHMCNATSKDLAKECGYTAPYISMLLTGKKERNCLYNSTDISKSGKPGTKKIK